MKLLIFSIFYLSTSMLNAQNLTQQQALVFAEKLYQVEIFSEKGRDTLIETIKKGKFSSGGIMMSPNGQFVPSYEQDLKLSYILKFCSQAFGSEFYFRSALDDVGEKIQDDVFKGYDINKLSEIEHDKLSQELQKRKSVLEGPSIENAIAIEDTLPENFGYSIHPLSFPSGANLEHCVHKKRSVIGKTRTRTLNDLLKIGLINQRIYDETLPKIQSNQLYLEVYLLDYLYQRVVYYEDFDYNKKKELALLEQLKTHKILSENGYNRLISTYKPYELKNKLDYMAYCNNAIVLNSKDYTLNPEEYYPLIFDTIKSILPKFNFTNLIIKIIKNSNYSKDFIEQKVSISFDVNKKTYRHTFWHDLIKKKPEKWDKKQVLAPVRDDFHKGINKWLADINSNKRLYFANNPFRDETGMPPLFGDKSFGLILLDEQQFKAWGDYEPYFMQLQSYDNSLNTEGVQKIISEYQKIGLFNHLSKTEIDSAKIKIDEAEISNYAAILSFFPKNILYFDWESGNLENPYQELTLEFAAASRGAFTPTHITDNFLKDEKNEKTHYGFTFKNKRYETDLEMKSDWLDPAFKELIDTALKEQNVDGAIYSCINNGQEGGYIFLNKMQYNYLKKYQSKLFEDK